MTRSLPGRPSLEFHRKEAKSLLRAARAGDVAARDRLAVPDDREPRLADAQRALAREYGFPSWGRFRTRILELQPALQPTAAEMSESAWDAILDRARKTGATALEAGGQVGDRELVAIGELTSLERLDLSGCRTITDDGLARLGRLARLEQLDLGRCPGVTDRGIAVLGRFPELRKLSLQWARGITDRGIAVLADHRRLQRVDLLGTATGDGALEVLAAKPDLDWLRLGDAITDDGLTGLQGFPAFRNWNGVEPRVDILSDRTGVTTLMINRRSGIGDAGLANLLGLDGLAYLRLIGRPEPGAFDSRQSPITSAGIRRLAGLASLTCFAGPNQHGDDRGLADVAELPRLVYLSAQEAVATDAGFTKLTEASSLRHLFAPECPNITGRALGELAGCRQLEAVAVGGPAVDDAAFAKLADLPRLRQLIPACAGVEAFARIGRLERLEILDCMFCPEVNDRAVAHLGGLPRLRRFRIWGTAVGDDALGHLAGMRTLQDLEFEGCKGITNRGVEQLAALPALRRLRIARCPGVSGGALAAFPASARVDWSP